MHTLNRYVCWLVVALWVTGCTAIYHREFIVETLQPSSALDREQIVERYRQWMESNGYIGSSVSTAGGKWVSFTIRDAQSRLLSTSRITDTITVGIDTSGDIRVEILRVSSYPPDDFSEKYVTDFMTLTEKYMGEAAGKDVKLRVIRAK